MPRYVVSTRRGARDAAPTALAAVGGTPGVEVIGADNPNTIVIDTTPEIADGLRQRLEATHIVEDEVRRGLT